MARRLSDIGRLFGAICFAALVLSWVSGKTHAASEETLRALSNAIAASDIYPGAGRFGDMLSEPQAREILDDKGRVIGHAILNTDYLASIGYSGKPIFILIGIDQDGEIRGAKMVKHSEPIVLAGIPISKINDFIDNYAGRTIAEFADPKNAGTADIIASATVTVIVIDDSIRRSALLFAQAMGMIGASETSEQAQFVIDNSKNEPSNWQELFGDGSVRRMLLNIGEINTAFEETGHPRANRRRLRGQEEDVFIDLYAALVSVPTIGRTLLGDAEYELLQARLTDNQHAILIMANGEYSFRGSGFVRGGIFDRFQMAQSNSSWLFRDKAYKRIGALGSDDAPEFSEIGLFILPENDGFDPIAPWRIQLLINRAVGPLDKIFINRNLSYQLPKTYLKPIQDEAPVATIHAGVIQGDDALWKKIWQGRIVEITILGIALISLTVIFYSQMWLASRPRLLKGVRAGYLLFTLIFIGGYAGAQLSIVNIFTFFQSLTNGFSWDYFLRDPLIFILWFGVAAALIFWGRGAFCGWLCPFGALQELLNMAAKKLKVPQIEVPWFIHERLWPIKYIIFLTLFGLSLYSLPLAEEWAEIEPFKTAIILKFAREWPYVIYAATLLSIGLFIERFFCRYLCPLGAALALPGRMRINDWLKRYKDCGSPCQRCAKECMVQAIHPEGHINPNECLYCLHCQELYNCGHRCPVKAKKWARQEKIARMGQPMTHLGETK